MSQGDVATSHYVPLVTSDEREDPDDRGTPADKRTPERGSRGSDGTPSPRRRIRGKGRLFWATSLWGLLWLLTMLFGAAYARSPYHVLSLPLSVLLPRCALIGGDIRSARLPRRWLVVSMLVLCSLRCVAGGALSIVSATEAGENLRSNTELLLPNILGVYVAKDQVKRYVATTACDVMTIFLSALYIGPMIGLRCPDAQEALEKVALHRSGMQLILAAAVGVAAFAMPSMRSLPLLLLHFGIVGVFAVKIENLSKWKVLHVLAQLSAVYCALLLVVDMGWQNAGFRYVDAPDVTNLQYTEWTSTGEGRTRAVMTLARGLALSTAIWAARRLHGRWGLLSTSRAVSIANGLRSFQAKQRASLKRTPVTRFMRWCKQTFPLLLLPAMVFVGCFIVYSVPSMILIVVACFGFIVTVDKFVGALPPLYILLALAVSASYTAALLNDRTPLFVEATGETVTHTQGERFVQFLQLGAVTICGAMWIVAFKMRKVRINRAFLTRRDRRMRLERSIAKVIPEMKTIEERFAKYADPGTGVIRRAKLVMVLHELTGERPQQSDIDQTWEYFTHGDRLQARTLASLEALTRALSNWDEQEISDSDESHDSESPDSSLLGRPREVAGTSLASPSDALSSFSTTMTGRGESATAALAELMISHEEAVREGEASVSRSLTFGRHSFAVSSAAGVFTEYPGRTKDESVPSRSMVFVEDTFTPGIMFSDFVVLHAALATYRMHNRSWFSASCTLASQLILRNTTALTLVFLFAAATYGTTFDAMRMGLITLFVAFLCFGELRRKYWAVIYFYVAGIINVLYAFKVLYRRQEDAPEHVGLASADVLGLRVVSPFQLLINFALLALAVMEQRVFKALQNEFRISRVFHEIEWRRLGNIPGAVALQGRFALLVAGACFVVVGLVESNSALVAGFLLIFGLVIVVGSHFPKSSDPLWILSTAYSVIALALVSLYQFRGVEAWTLDYIDGDMCSDAGKSGVQCAAEVGLSRASRDKPLVRVLLPWFIACTSNVVQLSLRLQQDKDGPTVEAAADTLEYDAYHTSQPMQLLLRVMALSVAVGQFFFRELSIHGTKIVWSGLIFAIAWQLNLTSGCYAVLFVLDRRGPFVVLCSALHMATTYIYPLFFVPEVPGYNEQWQAYTGIYKQVTPGTLSAPVAAFACSIMYIVSVSEARKRARDEEQARAVEYDTERRTKKDEEVALAKDYSGAEDVEMVALGQSLLPTQSTSTFKLTMSMSMGPTSSRFFRSSGPRKNTPCDFCTHIGCRGTCNMGCRLRGGAKMPILQRVKHIFTAARLQCFDTLGYEITLLFVLISMVFTCRRITAVVLFADVFIMWAAGRFRVMAQRVVPMVLLVVNGIFLLWLVAVAIGVAPVDDDASQPGPFQKHCEPWWVYMGCRVGQLDVVLVGVLIALYRLCHARAAHRLLLWQYAGNFPTLTGFLKAHRSEIEDLISFKRSDIEHVLPPPPRRDFLSDPQRLDELVVSFFIAFFPVSIFSFFHGALASNVISVMEMLLGLFLIVYARALYWRYPRYWPAVCAFFFGTLLVNLVSNLPPVLDWVRENPDIAKSLGIISWADSSAFPTVIHITVVWLALLQQRVFQEPYFVLKLRQLYKGSVVAVRRHYEVLDCMNRRAEQSAEAVREREGRLNEKLDQIRQARAKHVDEPDDDHGESPSNNSVHRSNDGSFATAQQEQVREALKALALTEATTDPKADRNRRDQSVQPPLGSAAASNVATTGDSKLADTPPKRDESPAADSDDRVEKPQASETDIVVASDATAAAKDVGNADAGSAGTPEDEAAEKSWFVKVIDAGVDLFNNTADGLIVWMTDQSYRGHLPPEHLPRPQRFALAAWNFLLRRTMEMCFVIFVANFVMSGTLCDMSFCLVSVTYALILLPWPSERFWDGLLACNAFGIFIKSTLRIVVENVDVALPTKKFIAVTFLDLGLNSSQTMERAAFIDIVLDFAVFGAILLHKQVCMDSGVYASKHATSDQALKAAAMTAVRAEVHDVPTSDDEEGSQHEEHHAPPRSPHHRRQPSSGVFSSTGGHTPLPRHSRQPSTCSPNDAVTAMFTAPPTAAGEEVNHLQPVGGVAVDSDGSESHVSMSGDEDEVVDAAAGLVSNWLQSAKDAGGAVGGHALYILANVKERQGVGLDLYTLYLAVDLSSLLYVAMNYYGLVGRATGSFVDSVQQDLLPGPLVVFLLTLVAIMVVDRIVYILGSLQTKFVLHLVLAACFHIAFVYWRFNIASETTIVGVGLFLIKATYLYVSCNQIRIGFALHRRHDPFTIGVTFFHWLGNLVYRSIPFLFEMRVLLDWTCARTSLNMRAWFTIEDIHRELYDRFYDIMYTEWTNPVRGTNYPFLVKSYQGVLNFVLIIVVLFFPLMYYSTFNPNLQPNRLNSLSLEVSFGPYSSFFTASAFTPPDAYDLSEAISKTRPTIDKLGVTEPFKATQLLEMTSCSSRVWGVSPQSRTFILEAINQSIVNGTQFTVRSAVHLSRVGATAGAAKEETMRSEVDLTEATLMMLYNTIARGDVYNVSSAVDADQYIPGTTRPDPSSNFTEPPFQVGDPVPLGALYDPFVFNKPADVETLGQMRGRILGDMATCAVVLNDDQGSNSTAPGVSPETWCVLCNPLFVGGNIPNGDSFEFPATGCIDGSRECNGNDNYEQNPVSGEFTSGPYVVAFSDPVPQDSNFLPNVGIIALYTTFILTLWTILRGSVTGYSHRIVMQQLAQPQPVAELISYIYLVRSVGDPKDDLELEELLYFELLDLIRGPDSMLRRTGFRMDDYDGEGKFARSYDINL